MKSKLGSSIRLLRKKRGLTQNEVSKIVGISRSYYCDIENDRVLPSFKVLLKINEVLKIFSINDVNSEHYRR